MEIPTTHRALLIPHGGTHTSTPIIFHSFLSVFVWFSNLQSLTGHVFGHWAFFFQRISLSSLTWPFHSCCTATFSTWLHFGPFQAFAKSFPVPLLRSVSICLYTSLSDGHWVLRPVRGHGDRKRQRTPNIQQMAGAPLNLPMSPSLAKHKAWRYMGLHFTPSPQP